MNPEENETKMSLLMDSAYYCEWLAIEFVTPGGTFDVRLGRLLGRLGESRFFRQSVSQITTTPRLKSLKCLMVLPQRRSSF